jgi:chromosomal replication initiator protein
LRFLGCHVRFIAARSLQSDLGLAWTRRPGLSREMRGGRPGRSAADVWSLAVASQAPTDDLASAWAKVRGELERSLPNSTFKLWLEPLRAVSSQGSTVLLTAPPAVRTWVERRYAAALAAALRRQHSGFDDVAFIDTEAGAAGRAPDAPTSLPVDPRHDFDRFVIGPGNRLAHAAALAVAELPGEAYNPLFLHGSPGLGKTHLLGAIVDYMRRNHPALTVHYTTAERFTAEFVAALRRDGPEVFKARYRELDALLIDDVQVLEGKERTEEEFVHTFNALYSAGKQIVLSSDRPPEALSRLAERLRDRFGWGLTVEVEPPDLRTRMALLWRLVGDQQPGVEPGVLHEIARRAPGNIRSLEGAMTRVLAISSMLSEPLSQPVVHRALGHPEAGGEPTRSGGATLEAIQDAVCLVHDLNKAELLSARRSPRIARARQIAMYLARELTELSLTQIARGFDRDHTTVLHAIRAVSNRLEPGSETAVAIHTIRRELGKGELDPGLDPSHRPSDPQSPAA